jgi:hypothetical protein
MCDREKAQKSDYRDLLFKQAVMAVYKLVDTVERLEDRLQEVESRVDALTLGINKEAEPIFYS